MASLPNPPVGGASGSDAEDSSRPNYAQEIDVDHNVEDDGDWDSTLASEISSYRSTSVSSSIYNYRYENGRRYHAYRDGRYTLPNDEAEQDRLDFYHHIFRLILGGNLFHAPISSNPQRVLDFGTGTGIWAIDFADEFPSALVIGTDLSPIQPNLVPPNCLFYVDDVESEWTFRPDEAFDLIHGRAMIGTIADFDLLYRRIYDNLKPGGWIEMQDNDHAFYSDDDPSLSKAPNIMKWVNLSNFASKKIGREVAYLEKQKLIDAGFENVHDDIYKVPIGTWAKDRKLKELGLYNRDHCVLCFESYTPGLLGRVLGWSKEEYQVLLAEVSQEVRNPKLHLYTVFRFIYGMKPRL